MKKSLLNFRAGRIWLLPLAMFMLLTVGACGEFFDTKPDEEKDEPIDKYDFIQRFEERKFVEPTKNADQESMVKPDEPVGAGELQSLAEKLSRDGKKTEAERRRRPTPFYEDFILIDDNEPVEVALVFNSVPLVDTLPAFADALGFNFTADSDLKSVVTLNINSTMTRRELWEAFDEMLKAAGAGVVRNGQMLKFMPAEKMPAQYAMRGGRNRFGATNEVISYALVNANSKDMATQLKPFLTKEGTIVELAKQNMLMITDHGDNIPKLKQILEVVDQPGRAQWPRLVIYCSNVKPSRIGQELSEVLPVIGLPVVLADANSSAVDPGAVRLSTIDRLQLLVATAATDESLKEIREWVRILDNADSAEQERAYVYKVAHSKAKELAQALAVIFTTQGSTLTVDTTSDSDTSRSTTERSETLDSTTTRNQNTTVNSSIANRNSTNNLTNTQIDKVSGVFANPVRIFADGVNNRLVIRTTPRTYATIKALLDKLDIMPAQVLMQVLIVEISLTNDNEFGIEFNTVGTTNNVGTSVGTNYNDLKKDDSTSEGFKFGIFNPNNPEEKFGFLRALAGREKIKVISSPQIVVSSNTEALVKVGKSVPILTSDLGSVEGSTDNIMRSYDYKNTGVNLTITPQITSTDLISLDLIQEVSDPIPNTITTATETPVINQRILQTSMTVANGKTMVIGGIIQESIKDNLKSIPFVVDIPIVSRLLGNTSLETERTELLVMITCYIINEKSRVEDMVRRYNESVKTLSKFEKALEDKNTSDLERAKTVHDLDAKETTENKN